MTQQAIIYCRVSSPKQVTEGHGLASQETRCREFAKNRGYEIDAAYHERGITGKLMDRPEIQLMLKFLRHNKNKEHYAVIIDDISRLARDIETHFTCVPLSVMQAVSWNLHQLNLVMTPIVDWLSTCWLRLLHISERRMQSKCKTV